MTAYLSRHTAAAQIVLKKVRGAIRKALPSAEESITYNMPTYKLGGVAVIYFAGWKQHFSLYPINRGVLAKLKDERTVKNSTARFSYADAVPVKLIAEIAKLRAREILARQRAST